MKSSDIFLPTALMIFYKTQTTHVTSDEVYVEWASIHDGKPGPAVPLSSKAAFSFSQMLSKTTVHAVGGFIPANMIYTAMVGDRPIMMWYTKPQKRKLHYAKQLNIEDGMMYLPWMLWYFADGDLSVFALTGMPAKKSIIYHAPFHNVYQDGKVCLGGTGSKIVSKDFTSYKVAIDLCEAAFFTTQFTHSSHELGVKGNINTLHKKLIQTGKPFPKNVLMPTKKTINSIISKDESKTDEGFNEADLLDEYEEAVQSQGR